jgi:ABC-2 type transport system permease protein
MTATAPQQTLPEAAPRLAFHRIVRSEWIKLRTLRSTVWSYLIVIVVAVGLSALMASTPHIGASQLEAASQARLLAQTSTVGLAFGQLVVAVLGVLVISGEYSTGMIRSTLTAVPKRLPALWAKAVVLFVATFVIGVVSTVLAFFASLAIFAPDGVAAKLFDPRVYLVLLGSAFYLAVLSVFSLGIGAILRNNAGGIAVSLGIILLLPTLWSLIPWDWARDAFCYLLTSAGNDLYSARPAGDPNGLEPWQDALVILVWTAVSVAGAALLLTRRDA